MYEKIYQEFITDFLPKVQEGLVITKDYFFDLFGRYVNYLIIIDSMKVLVGLIIIIGSIILTKKFIKYLKNDNNDNEIIMIVPAILLTIGCCLFFLGLINLAKDIYIPEVRIYQELNRFIINK